MRPDYILNNVWCMCGVEYVWCVVCVCGVHVWYVCGVCVGVHVVCVCVTLYMNPGIQKCVLKLAW